MTTSNASDAREEAAAKRRRAASQRVRDARDRLTSTSGTSPVFDYELLRMFAQNRLSASLVVLLLVATVGFLSSLWTGAATAGVWTAIGAPDPCRHGHEMPAIPGDTAVRGERQGVAHPLRDARPVLRPRLDVQSGAADRRVGEYRHLHAVRDAAGGRGLQHARLLAADRGVRGDGAGHRRGRDQFRAEGQPARLYPRDHGGDGAGLFPAARASALFIGAADAAGPRRKGHADRRTGAGQDHFRRSASPRRGRQHLEVALPRADEPRIADPAERHSRLLRGDEERDFRTAYGDGLQGLFQRHPRFRSASARPHQ